MKKWLTLAVATLFVAGSYGATLQDWQFDDTNGTALDLVANTGTIGTSWSSGGPKTQLGVLNIGDATFFKWDVGTGQTFRSATFAGITSGQHIFEFVIADWNMAGSTGETGNGIGFTFGDSTNGAARIDFEVAQSPGDDIRVRSQASNNGNLSGTDVQNQLGGLDLTNAAAVTVQLLVDLDTGDWSTQVDFGNGFVDLVTDGAGMTSIDRIQLIADGGVSGWLYNGTGGATADYIKIESVTLTEIVPVVEIVETETAFGTRGNTGITGVVHTVSAAQTGDMLVFAVASTKGNDPVEADVVLGGTAVVDPLTYIEEVGEGPGAKVWYGLVQADGTIEVDYTTGDSFSAWGAYLLRSSTGIVEFLGSASDDATDVLSVTNSYSLAASVDGQGLYIEAASSYNNNPVNETGTLNPDTVIDKIASNTRIIGHGAFEGISAFETVWTNSVANKITALGAAFGPAAAPLFDDVFPWEQLEYFNFDDVAGKSFNTFVNSGTLGSPWNNGAPAGKDIATDGAGNLVVNYEGQLFRKLPQAGSDNAAAGVDEYATAFTSGVYRLELNFASWDLDPSKATDGVLTWSARDAATGGSPFAAIRLKIEADTAARLQFFHGGVNPSFYSLDYPLSNTTPIAAAIEFNIDAGTATYYIDGVAVSTKANFTNITQVATLQFDTDTNWSSNSIVAIDTMGFSTPPPLTVDFDESQVSTGIQHEYVDEPLDLVTPKADLPNYLGQPIYGGLALEPVNGWTTGLDNGGLYTNGAAMSFGGNGGAKLQWNGPTGAAPGDDFGRYEENDVATGIFLFKQEDFLNGADTGTVFMDAANDTLSATVRLDTKDPARLKSGKFRWVVQDAGSFYISDEVIDMTSDTGDVVLTDEALFVNWYDYDPVSSITGVAGAAASPTLQDIEAIGFWMQATVATNNGIRAYPNMQCSSFETRLNVPAATAFFITDIQLINSNTDVQLTISGLTVGQDYQIQDSVNLPDGFINVGSPFAATDASAQVEVVPVNLNTEPDRFFQVIDAP